MLASLTFPQVHKFPLMEKSLKIYQFLKHICTNVRDMRDNPAPAKALQSVWWGNMTLNTFKIGFREAGSDVEPNVEIKIRVKKKKNLWEGGNRNFKSGSLSSSCWGYCGETAEIQAIIFQWQVFNFSHSSTEKEQLGNTLFTNLGVTCRTRLESCVSLKRR